MRVCTLYRFRFSCAVVVHFVLWTAVARSTRIFDCFLSCLLGHIWYVCAWTVAQIKINSALYLVWKIPWWSAAEEFAIRWLCQITHWHGDILWKLLMCRWKLYIHTLFTHISSNAHIVEWGRHSLWVKTSFWISLLISEILGCTHPVQSNNCNKMTVKAWHGSKLAAHHVGIDGTGSISG